MDDWIDQIERYCTDADCDLLYYSGRIAAPAAREFIDMVLEKAKHATNVSVFLATYGGDPHSAFRMVRCLKKHYSGGKIRLLIDAPCKSAGTLFALGVDQIAIGPRGELGPLDTQLSKQDELIFMNSGLDILQALSVVTANAFDSCFSNMIDIIKRSGGSISTKTAAEIASSVTTGVFQPITAQVDPLRMGEAHRSMRIAREYGERLKSPLLKPGMLERLVQDYPSHGFVIDKEEAEKYFSRVDDLSADELRIADMFASDVRWPKEEPEALDMLAFATTIRNIRQTQAQKMQEAQAVSASESDPASNREGNAEGNAESDLSEQHQVQGVENGKHDGVSSNEEGSESSNQTISRRRNDQFPETAESDGQGTDRVLKEVNGYRI